MRNAMPSLALGCMIAMLSGCQSDACEEAYYKMKDCVQQIDCPASPDEQFCAELKQLYAVDYKVYEQHIKELKEESGMQWSCDSSLSEAAQEVLDCSIDPKTCMCR